MITLIKFWREGLIALLAVFCVSLIVIIKSQDSKINDYQQVIANKNAELEQNQAKFALLKADEERLKQQAKQAGKEAQIWYDKFMLENADIVNGKPVDETCDAGMKYLKESARKMRGR